MHKRTPRIHLSIGLVFFFLAILLSNNATGQEKNKKSYSKNPSKIENVKGRFGTCTSGPCYSGWGMVLKLPDQLLFQWSVHHPVAETRYVDRGTWQIKSDTLILNILSSAYAESYMFKTYMIKTDKEYNVDFLLPIDGKTDWDATLKEIKAKFLISDHYITEFEMPKEYIRKEFKNFVLWEYGESLKLLVGEMSSVSQTSK